MEVYFNTDKHIDGKMRTEQYFSQRIKEELARFEDRITRIEVHLSDQNGSKKGIADKKCIIEARPQGLKPIVVSHQDFTVEKSINSALKKLTKSLNSVMGKLQSQY